MTSLADPVRSNPFDTDRLPRPQSKDLPLLSSSSTTPNGNSPCDPMDLSPHNAGFRDSLASNSPGSDRHVNVSGTISDRESHTNGSSAPVGAAAAAQQPKVVQTAFIHKLYSMLEDHSIQHLISWSQNNESFVMSPSTEFSKVLASYFKHTNISSFVRQLNMYGFHKVSDVFHTGSPDSPLWEFKHGGGSFKRGDLVGLREIKRRASRHTLIHRDSFSSAPKMPPQPVVQQPPPPPMEPASQDPLEARLSMMDYKFQDLYNRLAHTEEAFASLSSKCQSLFEGLSRCHQWSNELSTNLLHIIPDPENAVHKDVSALRSEIARQQDSLRFQDREFALPNRHAYITPSASLDPAVPVSPRNPNFDATRRPSLQVSGATGGSFRAPMPPHLQISPRRNGSLSVPDGAASPSSIRPPGGFAPPPPPPPQAQAQQQHPLASASSPSSNLSRRHTSADIRLQGWQGGAPPPGHAASPYQSGQNSTQWPSSPYRAPANAGDQQLRDALAKYELPKSNPHQYQARQTTPPPDSGSLSYANTTNEAGWQLPGPKFPFRGVDFSAPPTRRSSMASNVHSLLNPAETAEREGEDEPPEERKRKRMI